MIFRSWLWPPFGSHFEGVLGAQMEANAIKSHFTKTSTQMMPQMSPNWPQRGSQNGIIKNEVLEAPCFKGGSQVASRPPPGSILERFWDYFGTIFVSFSNICLMTFACILSQHVANKYVQNHKESSKECSSELPRNNFSLRAVSH